MVPSYMLPTETRSKQSELVQQETIRRQHEKEMQRKLESEAAAVRVLNAVSGYPAARFFDFFCFVLCVLIVWFQCV